jgi:hypothetical protein
MGRLITVRSFHRVAWSDGCRRRLERNFPVVCNKFYLKGFSTLWFNLRLLITRLHVVDLTGGTATHKADILSDSSHSSLTGAWEASGQHKRGRYDVGENF